MTELGNHEDDIGLARLFPVSVLITAPLDRALAIAAAIADDEIEDLIVHEVDGLNETQQTALLQLLESRVDGGQCRVIATSSTSLFERVREGRFLGPLFYRLNVIHIVSGARDEGVGTSSRPIIAA
jgi:hypothetical protein